MELSSQTFKNRLKAFGIVITYCLLLFSCLLFRFIYSFGYIVDAVFVLELFFFNTRVNNIKISLLLLTLFVPIFILTNSQLQYFILDFFSFFIVFSILDSRGNVSLSTNQQKIINSILVLYLFLTFVYTQDNSLYEDGRYNGLFPSASVSSSVVTLISMYFIEFYRGKKNEKTVFLINFSMLILNMLIYQTRSMLFAFPYFFYLLYHYFLKGRNRILGISLVLLISVVSLKSYDLFVEKMRLATEDDASYATRQVLYIAEIDGIADAKFVLPHGFNACLTFVRKFTGSDTLSPHNNLLGYWYDFGLVWLIILFIWVKKIYHFTKETGNRQRIWLIYVFLFSCALHNILLSPFVWIPMLLILRTFKNNNYAIRFNSHCSNNE